MSSCVCHPIPTQGRHLIWYYESLLEKAGRTDRKTGSDRQNLARAGMSLDASDIIKREKADRMTLLWFVGCWVAFVAPQRVFTTRADIHTSFSMLQPNLKVQSPGSPVSTPSHVGRSATTRHSSLTHLSLGPPIYPSAPSPHPPMSNHSGTSHIHLTSYLRSSSKSHSDKSAFHDL